MVSIKGVQSPQTCWSLVTLELQEAAALRFDDAFKVGHNSSAF
jgi:hypothetical protein